MKRIAALLLLLFLLPFPAAAEDTPQYVADFVNEYNSYCTTFSVPPLPMDGWRDNTIHYSLSFGDAWFSVDEPVGFKSASILIPIEDANLDFLAACACLSAAIRGFSPDIYTDLMTVYIALRTTPKGENAKYTSHGGIMVMTEREEIILFMVTK